MAAPFIPRAETLGSSSLVLAENCEDDRYSLEGDFIQVWSVPSTAVRSMAPMINRVIGADH